LTLILGARCQDGIILAADRRRMVRHEIGPDTNKLFKLDCSVLLAGAGDDAVLNEAKVFIEHRIEESQDQLQNVKIFDIVEITIGIVNELVNCYRDKVEEPFGYALAGLENINGGAAKLYTIFGAGFSEVPWACIGSGSSYARPLVELLLADGSLTTNEATKVVAIIFTLVSNVQATVGGGVDVSIIKDGEATGEIKHFGDTDLNPLRVSILNSTGVRV
jgi:20S proteasome alpha/beta subunit